MCHPAWGRARTEAQRLNNLDDPNDPSDEKTSDEVSEERAAVQTPA
ncbi:hypothetical protein AB0B50_08710 [Streptomyces sp. NPDC041068]